MFNTRQDLTEWAIEQFNKYGIRQPETYTEQEIKDMFRSSKLGYYKAC